MNTYATRWNHEIPHKWSSTITGIDQWLQVQVRWLILDIFLLQSPFDYVSLPCIYLLSINSTLAIVNISFSGFYLDMSLQKSQCKNTNNRIKHVPWFQQKYFAWFFKAYYFLLYLKSNYYTPLPFTPECSINQHPGQCKIPPLSHFLNNLHKASFVFKV